MENTNNDNNIQRLVNNRYKEFTYYNNTFWTVPKNYVLVLENKYNGRVKIKYPGFRFNTPFIYRGLYVPVRQFNIDEPKMEFDDKAGQKIYIDYELTLQIIKPAKYLYVHENPVQQVRSVVKELVRTLVEKATWEEMVGKRFGLTTDGSTETIGISEFDKYLKIMRRQLDNMADEYGLEVISLYNKEIQQSEEMQRVYDEQTRKIKEGEAKKQEALKNKEIAQIQADTRLIEAKAAAEAYKIENKAKNEINADRKETEVKSILNAMDQVLKDLTEAQRMEVIKAYVLTNGENPNTSVFSGVNSGDLLAGMTAKGINNTSESNGFQKKITK